MSTFNLVQKEKKMTEEENNAAEDVEELILFLLEYDNNFSIQLKCHLHHV
jgi:hypothetical protein